ncbi:hypothetical protein K432DRAFT_409857 [Lepidopterella palustris CBS 459.81]|uniref:Uncharacterized protein n=1 Tax=Lepidopterella palustris CBS 459.81 TaxID=1314670 RepID=A0A8E2DZM4_9PEZI|nr:hypothetical protein K432DRAFT_409857 [Lepidopterella palustris CBS 459.81]
MDQYLTNRRPTPIIEHGNIHHRLVSSSSDGFNYRSGLCLTSIHDNIYRSPISVAIEFHYHRATGYILGNRYLNTPHLYRATPQSSLNLLRDTPLASPSTTTPSPRPSSIIVPNSYPFVNGTTFTIPNAGTSTIVCGVAYPPVPIMKFKASFEACVAECTTVTECGSVDYVLSSGTCCAAATTAIVDITASSLYEEEEEVEIPAVLDRIETYVFMGFTPATAKVLWERFSTSFDNDLGQGSPSLAKMHIEHAAVPDATSASDSWDGAMAKIGISDRMRAGIPLPEFEDVRSTATLKFWLVNVMQMAFLILQALDEQLRQEAPRILVTHKIASSVSETPPSPPPLSGKESLKKMLSSSTTPLQTIASSRNTPTPHIAPAFKHRLSITPITIIQVAVPESFTKSPKQLYLTLAVIPSEGWMKIVWSSRRGLDWPTELAEKEDNTDIIMGHILSARHVKYE